MMDIVCLDTKSLLYERCGKFRAPSSNWLHMSRQLTDYELMVVTEGCLNIAGEGKKYVVSPGEYLLMSPGIMQQGYRSSFCSFYWLHFFNQAREAEPHIQFPAYGKLLYPDRIVILMKQLADSAKRYHCSNLNSSHTMTIINELFCQYKVQLTDSISQPKSQLCDDVANYIQYYIEKPLKTEEVASHFGYNSKYLSSLFKTQMGVSMKKYILQQKMEHAMALLSDTNQTISQIAFDSGFDDVHNFTNAFKKEIGMSPSKYRESFERRDIHYQ